MGNFEQKREVVAKVYTVRMASAAVGYRKFMNKGRELLEGYLTECAQLARSNRDVGYVARGCRVLVNGANKICETRQEECWNVARSMVAEYPRFRIFIDAMDRDSHTSGWLQPPKKEGKEEYGSFT